MLKYFWLIVFAVSITIAQGQFPNSGVDFESWKHNSIRIAEKNCEKGIKIDGLYEDECKIVESIIELISTEEMDSIFSKVKGMASEYGKTSLKYYIRFYVFGEFDQILQYFIFDLDANDFLVIKHNFPSTAFSKSLHPKIKNRIYAPKQNFNLKNEDCDHSAIITEFKDSHIVKNDVIICPKVSYYPSLLSLMKDR